MKITIEYESSWRNSFLDGNNNEPLPKQKDGVYRKFIGSMRSLDKPENFIQRNISLDTVMGLLNRLIGDQRKLYQSRASDNYYFKNIESVVKFEDKPKVINQEMTFIRNITGSTDQNSFSGLIKTNHPMLSSDFSKELWGVLGLTVEEICTFINDIDFVFDKEMSLDPTDIVNLAEFLDKKSKPVENNGVYEKAVHILNSQFPELTTVKQPMPYIEKNGGIKPIRLYAASLYIQLERLIKKYDMGQARTKAGKIAGFSKRGFNGKRDFMKNFTTGGEKKIWGNPYIHEQYIKGVGKAKGEGKVKHLMTKASGVLDIEVDITKEQGHELSELIENAGVSSFYLGKKGLAYVTKIRV